MTLAFLIYFVALLPSLKGLFAAAIGFSLLGLVMTVLYWTYPSPTKEAEENKNVVMKKTSKRLIISAIVFSVLTALVPSEKTAWWMLGGYAAQTVYQSEEGAKYRNLIMKKIDEAVMGVAQ